MSSQITATETLALKNFEQRFGRATDTVGSATMTIVNGTYHETQKALWQERLRRFEQAHTLIRSALDIMKECP
jgi:hypothetical protein